jgi:hypothetical protein
MYNLSPETTKQAARIIESWASLQWKVLGHHFTREDMIQEGYIVLDRVVTRYPSRSANHLLSTLAASLQNRSNDLSRKPDRIATTADLSVDAVEHLGQATMEDSFDRDYPGWLEALLSFAADATPRQIEAMRSNTADDYLARKVGLPVGAPVRSMVQVALGVA